MIIPENYKNSDDANISIFLSASVYVQGTQKWSSMCQTMFWHKGVISLSQAPLERLYVYIFFVTLLTIEGFPLKW